MHIWNVTHPNTQYDTVEYFVKKIQTNKITVDSELDSALTAWDFKNDVMNTGVYENGYFDLNKTIYATDLPVDKISNDTNTTLGLIGDASWGVRKSLGWTGERLTGGAVTSSNVTAWADVKKRAIESVLAGKPIIFECLGYSDSMTHLTMGGLHAVAAIGYDADTDMFKIVDSTWGMPSDEIPMVYWTSFECLLEPSDESAVWIFSDFDSEAVFMPM